MHISRCGRISDDYLIDLVYLSVQLAVVKHIASLLYPADIHILMAFLVGLVITQLDSLAHLYLRVLLARITSTGRNDEAGINDTTLVELKPIFHEAAEAGKQLVIRTAGSEFLTVFPYHLLIGDIVHTLYNQKVTETGTVHYLILYLMVAQTIVILKEQYFEH